MSDLTVVARRGQWMLVDDDDDAELGAFGSRAEALTAAGEEAFVDQEPRYVLIHDPGGEDWDEEVVEPPALH